MKLGTLDRPIPSRVRAAAPRRDHTVLTNGRPLLVLIEGIYDVEFLCRISAVLRRDDHAIPDLRTLEEAGCLIFVPFGGGDPGFWATRFAPLGLPEVHIYDRETLPESRQRLAAASRVNCRPNARAFVTSHCSIENYLHPDAIESFFRIRVSCPAESSIVDAIADSLLARTCATLDRSQLSRRGRRRLKLQIKRKLNHDVVLQMTPVMLDESDPRGEVRSWLTAIADAVGGVADC